MLEEEEHRCTVQSVDLYKVPLSSLTSTLALNVLVCILLLLIFECVRKNDSMYYCRRFSTTISRSRIPPPLPRGWFIWIPAILRIPKERVLFYAGLDAYLLLRYIRMCARICAWSAIYGLAFLIPIYYLEGSRHDGIDPSHWISLGHLPKASTWNWVPVVCTYLTAFHVLHLLKYEYNKFLRLRIAFLTRGDPDVSPQKTYTVRVEKIPLEYRNNAALFSFFEDIFPEQVHSAVVCFNIEKLESLVRQRHQVLSALEAAIAYREVTGKEPYCWVLQDDTWSSFFLRRGDKVSKIEHLEKRLADLNQRVSELQMTLKQESEALNKVQRWRTRSQEEQDNLWDCTKKAVADSLVGNPEMRSTLLEAEMVEMQQERMMKSHRWPLNDMTTGLQGDFKGQGDGTASKGQWTAAAISFSRFIVAGAREAWIMIKGAMVGTFQALHAFRLVTVGSSFSSTGFVTFRSLTAAATAGQALLTARPFVMGVSPAPEPRDIIWPNIAIPMKQIDIRKNTVLVALLFLSIFWGSVVLGIYRVSTHLHRSVKEANIQGMANAAVAVAINNLPPLILLIIMQILPWVFFLISHKYERLKTHSQVQASITGRFVYAQMVTIFATIVGGGIISQLKFIIDDPSTIVDVLGCTMPDVAVYFMQVIIMKTFVATPFLMARTLPLLVASIGDCIRHLSGGVQTERQKRTHPIKRPMLQYGWVYPSILLVLTLSLTYSVIMPLVVVFGLVYFLLIEFRFKYHVCYIFIPQYEGGGALWYQVFNWTIAALTLSQLTLIGHQLNLGNRKMALWITPLPLLIIPFYLHCRNGYYNASIKMSLVAARKVDKEMHKREKSNCPPSYCQKESQSARKASNGEARPDSPNMTAPTTSPALLPPALLVPPPKSPRDWTIADRTSMRNMMAAAADEESDGDEEEREEEEEDTLDKILRTNKDIFDYFELSAYTQPSLGEPPQQPEPFVMETDGTPSIAQV